MFRPSGELCDCNLNPEQRASRPGPFRTGAARVLAAGLCLTMTAFATPAAAQSAGAETVPLPGSAAVLSVVRWNGSLPQMAGRTVELTFSLFEDQAGGLALWHETQTVKIGGDGRYSVLLGATSAEGLPQSLFQAGEARWVEARVLSAESGDTAAEAAVAAAPARTLLAAVPYAFKSVDSETLAGRAAADYVTREDLRSAVAATLQTAATANPETSPAVTGTGTTGYVPMWTGATTLGDSVIAESGTKIGIGTTAPATTLDVKGASTLRGAVSLPATAATATAGANSPPLEFGASAYSSTAKAAVAQNFTWEAVNAGNNTAAPTANLELFFGKGTATPAATGLSISSTGHIAFAAGQTFPGTIKSVAATSPLTAITTSGAVSLELNAASLETTLNGVYPRLSAANHFTGATNSFTGAVTAAASGASGSALTGKGTAGAAGVTGTSAAGSGVHGLATSLGQEQAGVLGVGNVESAIFGSYNIYGGVWGDSGTSSTTVAPAWAVGVIGTADDSRAGVFLNNSSSWTTLYVQNYGSGGATGLFKTFMAVSREGTCGIGSGSLSCTGQVKSLVSAGGGARVVETYSVQSPENWMEDFGSGQLQRGIAVITIDPAFAETISADAAYHVFITPNGDSKGLYVIRKTAGSFEVRESGGGTSSLYFDYRIVAKRRGYETERLQDVTDRFTAESAAAIRHKATADPRKQGPDLRR